ncbi:vitamin K epoxide reductase family protein [Pseudonocardia sichuanensis]
MTRTRTPVAPAPGPRQTADLFTTFLTRVTGWVLTVGGGVGTAAAFALILDRIALLEDPAFIPSCNISPLLSCGSVMTSPQAEAFGFPNPLIGLVAFPVVTTIGVITLASGTVPRWVWLGLQAGALGGLVFVHWLIAQSLYVIGTLCPYCMAVWVATIAVFCYTTLHNLRSGRLPVPPAWRRATSGLATYHGLLVTSWLLVVVALIAARFWPYWTGLLG